MDTKEILQATGDFPFKFYIEKAQAVDEEGEMIITGVASTMNVDHDNERMSERALSSMAEVINDTSVPLRIEHDKSDKAIVGKVFKAWIDDRKQLWIKAILDSTHPASSILHSSLKQGAKLGLSVGGRVKKATREFSEAVGNVIKTFYEVALDEVSVTQRPANYDSWLLAKSIVEKSEDVSKYYQSPFYQEFLFENQQLDYLQSFAKSIPDKSWGKLTINKKNTMSKETKTEETTEETTKAEETTETKETTKTTKAEETETETTKGYASKAEVNALKSMVTKGFEAVTGILAKMSSKEEGTETTETTKAESTETETETKEKAMETTEHPSDEATEKAETETDTEDKYELKSMDKAINTIKGLTAKMTKTEDATETDETTKASTETETTTKSSGPASIDEFVDAVTSYVEALDARFAKSGMTVPGSKQRLVDLIKANPELQSEISAMLKEPGFKKSVSMGVPYMTTKEGKRIALVPVDETVAKSANEKSGKSFKDLYKTEFSSTL